MEIENNDKHKNIEILDIVNALAMAKAREAGLLNQNITNHEIGMLGAAASDAIKVMSEYQQGKITYEESKQKIKQIGISLLVAKFVEKVSDGVTNFLSIKIPVLSNVFQAANIYVKHYSFKIAQKVVEVGTKLFSKVKETLKAFFG